MNIILKNYLHYVNVFFYIGLIEELLLSRVSPLHYRLYLVLKLELSAMLKSYMQLYNVQYCYF